MMGVHVLGRERGLRGAKEAVRREAERIIRKREEGGA
jgi:hypothetical protein